MACVPSPDLPCRANLDLMPAGTPVWMYALSGLSLLVFLYGFWEMVRVWRLGKPWKAGDWRTGLKRLVAGLATHRKFMQDRKPGTLHAWVFSGFVVLFIGTVLVAIDADLFEHGGELLTGHPWKLLAGQKYLLFEAVLDLFGIVFLTGLSMLVWRRYKDRPGHLHRTANPEAPAWLRVDPDLGALAMLALIGVTGFALEAMRLSYQEKVDGITYASWSFAGNALSVLFLKGATPAGLLRIYPLIWYTHFFAWSVTLAILPWTKLKHIVTSSLNLYFHDPKRQSRPELPAPFSLERMLATGATDIPQVGYKTIRDLTWKDRLSLDACTNCGRCEAQCPATAAGRPLSPRKLIQDLKAEMWRDFRAERRAPRNASNASATAVPGALPVVDAGATDNRGPGHQARDLASADGVGTALKESTLWSCTTCRACVTACPVDIEHVDLIAEMRRGLVMESRIDEHQQKLLVNLTNAGNPYGFPAADRADWRNGLPDGITVRTAAELTAAGTPFEYLWWIGCSGSFDPRNQEVTRSIATILNAAKVDFAILGTEERCTADPARRLGEEGRFQQSAMENLAVLAAHGVRKVITQCPHCFNALGKEYPALSHAPTNAVAGSPPAAAAPGPDGATDQNGASPAAGSVPDAKLPFEVIHHTQLLESLLAQGRIPLKEGAKMEITYHDSCYLMRHNGIADAPRNVLRRANGLPVLEMAQNRKEGLCCGAGGANMWYEVKEEATRINVIRARQAADTGAGTVATACPFCLTMMTDGLSLTGQEGKMRARDLAEIVADNLDWTPPAPPVPPPAEAPIVAGGGWSG